MPESKPPTRAERSIAARKAREAEALRENLRKRKAQARATTPKADSEAQKCR